VVISPKALFILALRPLGGSLVTLTLFWRTVTGNDLVGMELRNNRKSSCTSAPGDVISLTVVSMANIQDAARWQFYKKDNYTKSIKYCKSAFFFSRTYISYLY
jgi:hypothetical protein